MRFKRVYAGLVASVMALTAVATPLTDKLPFAIFGESLSVSAGAQEYEHFTYMTEADGTVAIMKYHINEETVVIPSEIDGKTVTRISYDAFKNKDALKSVTIPSTVTTIDSDAFLNCPALKSVTIPESVTVIRPHSFGYSYDESTGYTKRDDFEISYTKNSFAHRYAVENGFTSEAYYAFTNNDDGTLAISKYIGVDTNYVVPSEVDGKKVTVIEGNAFENNNTLISVTVPDTVTRIGLYAFCDCASLRTVTVPESVTKISEYALGYSYDKATNTFSKSDDFTINYVKNTEAHRYAAANGFTNEAYIETAKHSDGTLRLVRYAGVDTEYNVPSEIDGAKITAIDSHAFSGNRTLTSVTIPDMVGTIASGAFHNCYALTEVTVPASVYFIGGNAFGYYYDTETQTDKKTDGFTINYAKYTVAHRYALENGFTKEAYLTFSESFDGKLYLTGYNGIDTDYTIPSEHNGKTITEISSRAFNSSTLRSVTVPDTVTDIYEMAFYNCTALEEINIPASVTLIGSHAFGYCYDEQTGEYEKVDGFKINYVKSTAGHLYALENGFTDEAYLLTEELSDGTLAVKKYVGHSKSYTVPSEIDGKKVTVIDEYAFNGNTDLESVTIPNGITEIRYKAFAGCSSLTSVSIPDTVTEIYDRTFFGCVKLKSVDISENITGIGYYAFGYYDDENKNTVKVDGFKINYVKNTLGHRYAAENGFTDECYLDVTELSDGTLSIAKYIGNDKEYVIPSEINGKIVTQIRMYAFADSTSLTSVTIPDSVTRIGYSAFFGCTALKTITVPESVKNIAEYAFGYYRDEETFEDVKVDGFKINYVKNTEGHRYALESGFTDESFIATEELSDGTLILKKFIGKDKEYTIPSQIGGKEVTQIGGGAFENCVSLEKITIPDSVTTINYQAFSGCTSLKSVNMTDSVYDISYEAFYNCPALKTVTLSASILFVGDYAFGYYKGENEGEEYIKSDDFKIICYKDTPGEAYAVDNGFEYTSLRIVPSAVKSLSVTAKSSDSLLLEWSKSSNAHGYIVEQYKGGQWTEIARIYDSMSYNVTGLNAATTYTFRVRAYYHDADNVVYGEYSRIAARTELDNVKGFVSSAASSSAIALGWERNVNADGYVIEQYKGGKWSEIARTKNNTTLRFTVKGLADYTAYSFRIKSYKTVSGVTVYSEYTNTKAKTDLGNVAEFTAAAAGTTAVKLDWSRNTKATAYVIEQYKGGQWTEIARTKNNYTLTFTVKGLAEGTSYSFRVKSVRTADGATEESVYKNAKATTLLSTVKGGKVTAADSSQLTLEWNRNVNASGYVIEQYKGGQWTEIARTKNNYTLTFTVKGLKGDTTYSFRMRSYKNIGSDTLYSDYVRIVGTTGLASVAGFKGTAVSQTSVKLSWSKNANAEGYVIEQYKGGKWTEITTTKSLTATVNGLAKGTAYSFRIKAYRTVDGAKEFSAYVTAKVTTAK